MDPETQVGEIDLLAIKTRSLSGLVTLISRTFIIRIISLAGVSLLSYFLGLEEFGLFAAVNNIVLILSYFSDIGFAAALIQKKDQLTLSELRSTFTLQQLMVSIGCLVLLVLSPHIFLTYHISSAGTWLFYSVLAGFFLASLKTIPSAILERSLMFKNLATVEVVENIVFWGTAVTLAWRGWGVTAYTWAVILRGITGTALIYYLSPWQIGFSLSKSSLKHLLSFGVPYQINSFIAVFKDRITDLFVWGIIGTQGVGLITWAKNYSEQPLRLIMDNVTKVTFPTFSRLQNSPAELKHGIEKTLQFISVSSFPFLAGLAILAPQIVKLIPRYSKWEAALLPLTIYCFNAAWASISTPLSNTLNSLGKVKINTYLMLMWLTLTWALTPWLAIRFGYLGVAYATGIIACFSLVPIFIVKKLTGFGLTHSVLKPLAATLLMSAFTKYFSVMVSLSWPTLILNIIISVLIFAVAIYLFIGPSLLTDAKKFIYVFRKK